MIGPNTGECPLHSGEIEYKNVSLTRVNIQVIFQEGALIHKIFLWKPHPVATILTVGYRVTCYSIRHFLTKIRILKKCEITIRNVFF